MFDQKQRAALEAPLARSTVKGRKQGGHTVNYIEGWHAIAEANRIFGFEAWTRETLEMVMVDQREREIGANKDAGWSVSYIARVRVTVQAGPMIITREGYGAGHGIDRDLGQAHESAVKEAETDAMKRALMTFGNPFGLALYDKEQTAVADEVIEAVLSSDIDRIKAAFDQATSLADLETTMAEHKSKLDALYQQDEGQWKTLSQHYRGRRKQLASEKSE